MSIDIPILLVAFNRPDLTRKVFNEIKKVKPKKLYYSIDGPRVGNDDENNNRLLQGIIDDVDWECEINTRFLESNLGCGFGVSSAISWVLEKEEYVIVLEDDCLPSQVFFNYCQELLYKYKDNDRVMMISGNNYTEEYPMHESYTFSRIAHHIWGWATWRRAWNKFRIDKDYFIDITKERDLRSFYSDKDQADFFSQVFNNFYSNSAVTHTWDFQWNFTIIANGGLTIVPEKNLVANIGLEGVHTSGGHNYHFRDVDNKYKIIQHPKQVVVNNDYDVLHFKNHWLRMYKKNSFLNKVANRLKKIINEFI